MDAEFEKTTHQDISNVYEVYDWYQEKYSEQKHIIKNLGYKPFLLNEKICNILINLDIESDSEKMNHKLKELLDDMSQSEKDSLSEEDLNLILEEFRKGQIFYFKIHELETNIEDGIIDAEISNLLVTAISDINISLSVFSSQFFLNAQPIMFHAQQAVEKFLKSLYAHHKLAEIRASGKKIDEFMRKKYQHHIDKLSQELNTLIPDFNTIDIKVQELHTKVPSMDIRYKDSGRTTEDAIHCINLMMEICGDIAKKIP